MISKSINLIGFGRRPLRKPASGRKTDRSRSLGGFIKNQEDARFSRLKNSRKIESAKYSSEMVNKYFIKACKLY